MSKISDARWKIYPKNMVNSKKQKTKNLSTISYQRTANVKAHLDAIGIAEIRQTTLSTGKDSGQLDVCGSMKGMTRSEDYLEDSCLFI